MRKLTLTFPKQIQEELHLLCLDQPRICKKEGALGWTSNQRIVIVRKEFFEYYNLHPGLVEGDLSTLKPKHFKAAINLNFIHEVNYLPKNKIRKTHLQLIFLKDKKVSKIPTEAEPDESQVMEVNTPNQDQLQKWIFEFKMDVKEFVEAKRQELTEEKRKMSKILPIATVFQQLKETPKKEKEFPRQNNSTRKLSMLETSQVDFNFQKEEMYEKNIEEYVSQIKKTKEYLKNKAALAEEQAARLKKKKERENVELLNAKNQGSEQFVISSFWRDYFRSYEIVVKEPKQKRSIQATLQAQLNLLRLVEYFNTIAVKLVQKYVDERAIGWEQSQKEFEGFKYYHGLWMRVGGKQLNQQFLVNYYINDIFYSLREIKNIKYRLPLMSLIKYKGKKVMVMCDLPFTQLQKTEVYNLTDEGFDLQLMNKLKENLQVVEDILNVKSQAIQFDERKKILAPLGFHLKIFQYSFKKDKNQDQALLPHFYYLLNPDIVFPLDYISQKKDIKPLARLRPQIVAAYREYHIGQNPQLLSQAFMKSTSSEEFKRHEDEKVIAAAEILLKANIQQLGRKLNQIELLILDSFSLKKMMEQKGINMRHLNLLYDQSHLAYLREQILVEALARTIKKQFRSALKDLQKQQEELRYHYERLAPRERLQALKERKEQMNKEYQAIAMDFLNLTFGKGIETEHFWKIIILKCSQYYQLQCSYPLTVKPGLLFHAVLWHCYLNVHFNKDIPLFKSDRILKDPSSISFRPCVKTFDYPSFSMQKLFRGAPSLEDRVSFDTFKNSTQKFLKLQFMFYHTIRFSFHANLAIAKMSNFKQYQTRCQIENPLHPALLPYYFINKSENNFYQALDILKFSLPQTHPLIVTLHLEYSSLLEPDLLKNTALMLAVRNFGEFHQKTVDLYSKFYHEGKSEYHVKALRIKNIQACKVLCNEMYEDEKFESCLLYCLQHVQNINSKDNEEKLGTGNFQNYLSMLMQALDSAIRTVQLKKGIAISEEISRVVSSFKYKDLQFTFHLFRRVLILHMLLSNKKYFLYKMVLLAVHIRTKNQKVALDQQGNAKPAEHQQQEQILEGLSLEFYGHESHSNWIKYVLDSLTKSFKYFNYLDDLFNNYAFHIKQYNDQIFKQCLGYWDILIRLYGQTIFKTTLYDVRFN